MTRLLGWLLVLGFVLWLVLVGLRADPGYVLLSWGTTSVEMSLVLMLWLWLASLWCWSQISLLERVLRRLWRRLSGARQRPVMPAPAATPKSAEIAEKSVSRG